MLADPEENRQALEEFTGPGNLDAVLDVLGIESAVQEMSSGGGGASSGYAGTVGKRKVRKRTLATEENNQTVDEVIKLLMERGIMT